MFVSSVPVNDNLLTIVVLLLLFFFCVETKTTECNLTVFFFLV